MQLLFENELGQPYGDYEKVFKDLLEVAAKVVDIPPNAEVDVNLVSLEEIQRINKQYRGIDAPTDVISFAFLDDEISPSIKGDDVPLLLGQICICVDKARSQAEEYGHSLNREMSFLFVHGLLHLLGYDHQNKQQEEIMFPLQEQILNKKEKDYE